MSNWNHINYRYLFMFLIGFYFSKSFSQNLPPKSTTQSTTTSPGKNESGTTPTYIVEGMAKLTSNFVDRGLSFSDGNPAFNGAFLIGLGNQFSLGFWGSNVANISNNEDNLWVKYVAEAKVDFLSNANAVFFFHDDHFYPSDLRNGQRYGMKLKYSRFKFFFEAQTNFEATGSSAFYTQAEFIKKYSDKYGLSLALGYTYQNSNYYRDYIDSSAYIFFAPAKTVKLEAGLALPSNTYQFGSRSTLHYSIGVSVFY